MLHVPRLGVQGVFRSKYFLAIPVPESLLSRWMEENPKVSAPGADRCLYGNPNDS